MGSFLMSRGVSKRDEPRFYYRLFASSHKSHRPPTSHATYAAYVIHGKGSDGDRSALGLPALGLVQGAADGLRFGRAVSLDSVGAAGFCRREKASNLVDVGVETIY